MPSKIFEEIFNKLTLEILNLLYEILRFDFLSHKEKTIKLTNLNSINDKKKGIFLENIILYLSPILEFDENYDKTIKPKTRSYLNSFFISYYY